MIDRDHPLSPAKGVIVALAISLTLITFAGLATCSHLSAGPLPHAESLP